MNQIRSASEKDFRDSIRSEAALEAALGDPATAMAATEALRKLVDAILVFPGERRGEVSVNLRGDLATFLHAAEMPEAAALGRLEKPLALTAVG